MLKQCSLAFLTKGESMNITPNKIMGAVYYILALICWFLGAGIPSSTGLAHVLEIVMAFLGSLCFVLFLIKYKIFSIAISLKNLILTIGGIVLSMVLATYFGHKFFNSFWLLLMSF